MREPIRDRQRLEHMIASIDNILQFVEGKTEESLSTEKVLFYAIVKNIEIVGEAAFKLTKAFCSQHSETPWRAIMKMRHVLVHDNYRIQEHEVWNVIEQDLRPLRDQVQSYIDTTNWEEWEHNEQAIAESAINKSLIETAKRMKADGLSTIQISRYTGLTIDEIEVF